jgi:hypothetical protein
VLWVLQNNFHSEPGYSHLVDGIERLGLPFVIVKPVPFTHRLLRADADTSSSAVDVEDLPEAEIDLNKPIFPMGSYTLAKIGKQRGWRPGAMLANLDYSTWAAAWGAGRLLNPNARICRFGDANFDDEAAFVRPVEDSKSFSGKVFERGEWRGWKSRVLENCGATDPLNLDTEVLIAAPVVIHSETRCWVVGGEIVTVSGYKRGKQVIYTAGADEEVLKFAADCIRDWVPNVAFVLDIAQTPDGCRIIEVNCLNAAGFYAAETMKLICSLEELTW